MALVLAGTGGLASGAAPQMKPQDFQRVVELVNKFTVNTTYLMNQFATHCDDRLATVARTLYRVECQVSLLEHKLDSIETAGGQPKPKAEKPAPPPPQIKGPAGVPKMPPGVAATNQPPAMPQAQGRAALPPPPGHAMPPPPPGVLSKPLCLTAGPAAGTIPPPPPMPVAAGLLVKTHPKLQGYFKMLDAGVDAVAVKAKMSADGHNPQWLDTPDAPSPLPAVKPGQKDEDSD